VGKLASSLRELAKVENASFLKTAFSDVNASTSPGGASQGLCAIERTQTYALCDSLIAQPDFFYQAMAASGITLPNS